MLKTTVQEKPAAGLTFPCLRLRKFDGIVVLFRGKHEGTIVSDGEQSEMVGHHTTNWISAESDEWEPVYSVTITQET